MSTVKSASAATEAAPPEMFLMQMVFGALQTQALYVATKLGIADLLAKGPLHVRKLAAETNTNERALYRVLRALSSVGVFSETDPKVFSLTPYAEPLRADAPNSLRNGIIFMGEEWHWRVWGNMIESLRDGKSAWGKVHGVEVFDYFAANPEQAEIFNRAMTDMSANTAPAIVEAYDFSQFETLADIAGGHGLLLAEVLKANPRLKGILFDVPHVIEGAGATFEKEGVSGRVETRSGNFFEAVPAGADAYMMKFIIHDWDDADCVRILSNINSVLKPDGKVLIIETVVPDGNEPHLSKIQDLEMLVSPGGVERTAEEYRELLAAAGLSLTRIVPTPSPFSIIEAVKANG